VRRYLRDPELTAAADAAVAQAARGDCRVLIGHSLGSMVALEYVRQHPEHRFALLLTLGSPLGLRMVQSRLAEPFHGTEGQRGIPDSVGVWVNVRDPRDPVACAGDPGRRCARGVTLARCPDGTRTRSALNNSLGDQLASP